MKNITDSMGRVITFVTTGETDKKLTQVKVKAFDGHEVIYSYSVDTFPNGYTKLTSFLLPDCLRPVLNTTMDRPTIMS